MDNSKFSPESFTQFYNSFFDYNLSLFKMIKNIREDSQSNDILDLACGTGISTRALSKTFNTSSILGIDSCDELIDYANQAFVPMNVKYSVHNALQLNTLNKKFDFIVAKSALHLINDNYIFNEYLDALNPNGTFYAIERTDVSVDSFEIFDDVKDVWKKQYNKQRKIDCINHYLKQDKYEIKTYKFGQKVDIDFKHYINGVKNKEMSCLWEFDTKFIIDWLDKHLEEKQFIRVFEEYDIIAITKTM